MAANGSSVTGHCSNVRLNLDSTSTCRYPTSSVLFDGVIPTLTALDENMWASRLMILYRPEFGSTNFRITTDFGDKPVNIRRVEVTIFNCPQWGTAVHTLYVENYVSYYYRTIATVYPTVISCDSLLKVCIPINISSNRLGLFFYHNNGPVHIAEVAFNKNSSPCHPFTTISGNWSAPEKQHQGEAYSYSASLSKQDFVNACKWTTVSCKLGCNSWFIKNWKLLSIYNS